MNPGLWVLGWSPDGEWIVAAGEHGADLVNAETGETLPLAAEGA